MTAFGIDIVPPLLRGVAFIVGLIVVLTAVHVFLERVVGPRLRAMRREALERRDRR